MHDQHWWCFAMRLNRASFPCRWNIYMNTYTILVLEVHFFKREVIKSDHCQEQVIGGCGGIDQFLLHLVDYCLLCQFTLENQLPAKQTTTIMPTGQKLAGCGTANELSFALCKVSLVKIGPAWAYDELWIFWAQAWRAMSTWAWAQLE